MNIKIEINEADMKRLVVSEILRQLGMAAVDIDIGCVTIETKSKQNYKSEWEVAAFRANCSVVTTS